MKGCKGRRNRSKGKTPAFKHHVSYRRFIGRWIAAWRSLLIYVARRSAVRGFDAPGRFLSHSSPLWRTDRRHFFKSWPPVFRQPYRQTHTIALLFCLPRSTRRRMNTLTTPQTPFLLSIIVPTYREVDNLQELAHRVFAAVS